MVCTSQQFRVLRQFQCAVWIEINDRFLRALYCSESIQLNLVLFFDILLVTNVIINHGGTDLTCVILYQRSFTTDTL